MPRHRRVVRDACRSYKSRFRTLGSGEIKYQRPGHVHKRFNKSGRQRLDLKKPQEVKPSYAKIMKKLGFVSRSY